MKAKVLCSSIVMLLMLSSASESAVEFLAPLRQGGLPLVFTADDAEDLPVSYDLRTLGRVTPIRNQNPWSTCWAFSAISALESSYLTLSPDAKPQDVDFSEMHMTWFTRIDLQDKSRAFGMYDKGRQKIIRMGDYGKALQEGGYPLIAVSYLARLDGPVNESDFPYLDSNNFTTHGLSITNPPSHENAEAAGLIPRRSSSPYSMTYSDRTVTPAKSLMLTEAIFASAQAMPGNFANQKIMYGLYNLVIDSSLKELVMKNGAAMIAYHSAESTRTNFNASTHAYYSGQKTFFGNHEVSVIGWDDNYPQENFLNPPAEDGAWLVRNNWGSFSGSDGGYEWMPYNDFIGDGVAFVVKERPENLRVYEHDPLGWCNSLSFGNYDIYAANIFRVGTDGESLHSIGYYTTLPEMDIVLEVYDLGTSFDGVNPRAGRRVFTTSENVEFPGYHTAEAGAISIEKGHYFSVVQYSRSTFTLTRENIIHALSLDEFSEDISLSVTGSIAVEVAVKGYSNNAAVYDGESYFSEDGTTWLDGTSIVYGLQKTDACGSSNEESGVPSHTNACIKAFMIAPNYTGVQEGQAKTIMNLEVREFSGTGTLTTPDASSDKMSVTLSGAGDSGVRVYLADKSKTYEPIDWKSMQENIDDDVDFEDDNAKGLETSGEWALVRSFAMGYEPDLFIVEDGITYPVYGPFVISADAGNLVIDVNSLKYAEGKDGKIPEGYYTAICEVGNAERQEIGVMHLTATKEADSGNSGSSGGGGGCNSLWGTFFMTVLSVAAIKYLPSFRK